MDIDFAYKHSNYEGRNSFNFPNEKTKMPSRSAVLFVALLATTLGLCRHSLAQSSDRIFFTPTSNQTVPPNSFDNVTYNCEVDANRILIWEVNMIPLEDIAGVREFEALGVFKVDQGTNRSTLIITRDAREEYSWQPISVRCSAFTSMPLQSDHSSFSYVITQYMVDCGTLANPGNGEVNHTAGTTIGQIATYSCNTGYNLVGDNTRTCQDPGVWSESAPTCQVVDCGVLTNPVNGSVDYTAGTTFRQTANYSCSTGYRLVGDSTQTCQATGNWSGSAPACQVVDCGALPNPVNGSVDYTAGTTFRQTANYSCNTGYRLVGDNTQTCQATGNWSGSAPACQIVDCGVLTNPVNGSVDYTAGTTFRQTANYSCSTGYRLVGDSTQTCQATGNWSGSAPTCQIVDCGALANPVNGSVDYNAGTTFRQTANYSCNIGYRLVGDSTQTCQAIGEWSGSAPTCQVVDCGTLADPANGRARHTAGTTFGQTATYSCNTGYNLVGVNTRTCEATGVWSGSTPTCEAVDCGTLTNPVNGQVSHSGGTTFEQTATYSCNAGYGLVGDNTRTCQATRVWSGSAPICQATQTSTGGVGTSDNRLNTNHLIGIIFGILGLVVAIIMPVSIPLARYYIRKHRVKETNLEMIMEEQRRANGSVDQQVEEQRRANGSVDQQGNIKTDAQSHVDGETPDTVYQNKFVEDGNFKTDARSLNVNGETPPTSNEGAEDVAQIRMVDESQQYDSLEAYHKQHKQRKEHAHSSGDSVRIS